MIENAYSHLTHSLFLHHEEIELEADVTSVSTNGMLERTHTEKKDVTSVIEKRKTTAEGYVKYSIIK